mgnify:CR=1 FL=1
MLVLSRKVGETLVIGDNISITVLSVEPRGNVVLGIDAPKDLLILRKELQQAASTNRESASADASARIINALEILIHPEQDSGKNGE